MLLLFDSMWRANKAILNKCQFVNYLTLEVFDESNYFLSFKSGLCFWYKYVLTSEK